MGEQEAKYRFLRNFSIFQAISLSLAIALVSYVGLYDGWAGSDLFCVTLVPFIAAFLISLAALFQSVFETKSLREARDLELLRRRESDTSVLDDSAESLYQARNAARRYGRYAPYLIAVFLFFVVSICVWLFWDYWANRLDALSPVNPPGLVFLAFCLGLMSLVGGVFCAAQSREREFRWLRGAGGWLIVAAGIDVLAILTVFLNYLEFRAFARYAPWVTLAALGILGAETLINMLFEFFRPRREDEEVVPLFESRILSVFTEPGGISRNLANMLEYQFGVTVSNAWFRDFWKLAVLPFVLFWLATLWLMTTFAEVSPGELGIREFCGRRACDKPLGPGIYLKWPWPIADIRRVPVDAIQEVEIGSRSVSEDGKRKVEAEVILWTVQHYASQYMYLVGANAFKLGSGTEGKMDSYFRSKESGGDLAPVAFMVTSGRVQYRVRPESVFDYAYRFEDPRQTLQDLAEGALVSYLAGTDFIDLLSVQRTAAAAALKVQTQQAADRLGLGVEILMVNVLDTHPPIEQVAPAFQEVIGARETRETYIQVAQADAARQHHQAESEANRVLRQAEAYRGKVVAEAEAEADRYLQQLKAYRAAPSFYLSRTFLDAMERQISACRVYALSSSLKQDVYNLDLKEKPLLSVFGDVLAEEAEKATKKPEPPAAPGTSPGP